jgi:hypothetical protein
MRGYAARMLPFSPGMPVPGEAVPGQANVVSGPFTTLYGGERPIDHVAARLPQPARAGHMALNYPNPGTGSSATPVAAVQPL